MLPLSVKMNQFKLLKRRNQALFPLLAAVVYCCSLFWWSGGYCPSKTVTKAKPVMHTFLTRLRRVLLPTPTKKTLDIWREQWSKAGRETRVLTLEDAKRHPRFSQYETKLHEQETILHEPIEYNRMCFLRWLARCNQRPVLRYSMVEICTLKLGLSNPCIGSCMEGWAEKTSKTYVNSKSSDQLRSTLFRNTMTISRHSGDRRCYLFALGVIRQGN